MSKNYTGWRAELDHLWRQFIAQCESLEESASNYKLTLNATPEQQTHTKGFLAGQAFAAKSIRRAVDHPKYDKSTYPLFADDRPPDAHLEALEVTYRAWARDEGETNEVLLALGRYLDLRK